jgi:hypothetical protein
MSEPNNRLMKARRVAGFRSARAAAAALSVRPATYAGHESGARNFSVADARRYAELYEVSPGWILTGEHFEGGRFAKIRDESLLEPTNIESKPETEVAFEAEGNLSDRDIFNFGKHALELLRQLTPEKGASQPEHSISPDHSISVGEVIIKPMLYEDFDPNEEQWEIVEQWQIPKNYLSEMLNVTPVDVAIIAVIDDNMSPTYQIKDRLIVDFEQKKYSADGVYIFIDLDEKFHIQRIEKLKNSLKLTNDNPADSVKHPTKIVDEKSLDILGKVCGAITTH